MIKELAVVVHLSVFMLHYLLVDLLRYMYYVGFGVMFQLSLYRYTCIRNPPSLTHTPLYVTVYIYTQYLSDLALSSLHKSGFIQCVFGNCSNKLANNTIKQYLQQYHQNKANRRRTSRVLECAGCLSHQA